jgi:hypothetical protein
MKKPISLTVIILLPAVSSLSAATHYVSQGSTNPTPPYTNWITATTNIQDAVNVAAASDVVLVTNGVYPGNVSVTHALALLSVNGPQSTIINGGGTNQCVYLADGASLTGFTLTNGSIWAGGGGGVECASTKACLTNCLIVGNSAAFAGGGVYGGTLYNCTVSGNSAYYDTGGGGGANWCTLYNCTLSGNSAPNKGGGAGWCTLYNCTLSGNSAAYGGGAYSSALYNCIVYYNRAAAEANYDSSSLLNYCCTTPLPAAGVGNLALDPQLASTSHLSADSPCRGAGNASYASGTDIDDEPWGNPPAIGCDEYHAGAVTGPLTGALVASETNVPVGYMVSLTALIEGRTTQSVWDFGDGAVVSNQPYTSHAWTGPGDYAVVLRAYNEANVAGVSAAVTIHVIMQPVHYVAASSPNPLPPYSSWATAARNIQDAVDAASFPRAAVVVTNGVYPGGVQVTKPLMLLSVNGPQFTIINGGGRSQCIYLADGASLTGFALTNGSAGGVGCASRSAFLTNCWVVGNSGGGAGGGTLYNCTLSGNSGSGASGGTLYNCALSGNSGYDYGGGAYWCALYNCTLAGNSASKDGGGAFGGSLYNCTLHGNSALNGGYGGGTSAATLYNCTLTGNSASYGGGAAGSTLYNCIVYYNTASEAANYYGSAGTLNYCCTTPLPTNGVGNFALDPQLASASHLSAGSPCRGAGSAAYAAGTDIDGEPWGNPPSIGCDEYHAGAVTGPLTVGLLTSDTNVPVGYAPSLTAIIEGRTTQSAWDFGDGVVVSNRPYTSHAWTAPGDYVVALRAYNEANAAGVSATVTIHVVTQPVLYVAASNPNPRPPYASWATAARNIQDAVNAASYPRAAVLVTNGVYPGGVSVTKPLTLLSVNGPQFTTINGGGTNKCVSLTNGASLTGFTLTSGHILSESDHGGGVACASANAFLTNCWIVGNSGGGAYGGTLCNCTLSSNSGSGANGCALYNCTLSGNSAGVGGGAFNCTLYNCTLNGNSAAMDPGGGGAVISTLYNCTLRGNSATYWGGGAHFCTLYNCTLGGNWALYGGGGASSGTLYNCTLTGNSARGYSGSHYAGSGGGAVGSTLYNCILCYNTAAAGANYDSSSTLNYCCTTPLPTNGVGNISNGPLFVDSANGNLRLQANSPCINAGSNAYVTTSTDLDGNPRIVGGTVDMGGYECQSPALLDFYNWLQTYQLSTSASSVYLDGDGDGMNNWQEWVCGTNPTNRLSVLRLLSPSISSTNVTVTWQSVAGVNYFLERSANLAAPFTLLATNILGQAGTTSYADTNAAGKGPFFYRVGIRSP